MKPKLQFFVVPALTAMLLSGCWAKMRSGDYLVWKGQTEEAFKKIRSRAAFEMSCPKTELRLVVVAADGHAATQVGVSGCGHKQVYVLVNGGWVLNSSTRKRGPG